MDKSTSKVIKLDFPITVDGQEYTELTIRRPKVRDNIKAEESKCGDFKRSILMLADLVEQPVEVVAELDEVDLIKLQDQYQAFTGRQGDTTPKT